MEEKKITYCKYNLIYDYYVRDDGTIYSVKSHKIFNLKIKFKYS